MAQAGHGLYEQILARRSASARNLIAPGPDATTIERIVTAGLRAPDHGRLAPFRFVEIGAARRGTLAEVFADAARELDPAVAEGEIAKAREKATQGPCLIGLIGRIDPNHPKIVASDQWLTVGCALENMLLAAQAHGFAAAVRSGRYLETQAVRRAFSLGANEHFTCLIALGTPAEWPPAKPKPALGQVFSIW